MRSSGFLFYALFSLFFGAVLFPDFIPSIFGSYADQRLLLSISLVVLTASGLIWLSFKGGGSDWFDCLWPFFLLLSSFVLAAVLQNSQPFGAVESFFYALFFLCFGVLGGVIRQAGLVRESAQAAVQVSVVFCFFYGAMTITVYLFAIVDGFSSLDEIIPWGFVNIRYWSHVATWVIPLFPLAILLTPWKESRLWQIGVAFTTAIWWWIIFLSFSRGSMVGLAFGFLLVWVVFGHAAFAWMKLFVRFVIYGLVVWLFLSVLIPSLVFDDLHIRNINVNSSGRMPLWREAWAMSTQNFPFGMGPQSWLTHVILTDTYRSSPKLGHPHNMYLMWAAEYGWISIFGLFFAGSYGLKRLLHKASALRKMPDPESLWLTAFTSSVTAALVHAGVSAVFIAPGSMLVGLLVLAIFWALILPERTRPGLVGSRLGYSRATGSVLVLVFLVAGGFWFRDVLRYQHAMEDDLDYYQNELSLGHLPRFWFHGNFPRHPTQMP